MMRIELINKISEDILKVNDDIQDIITSVKEYEELLDDTIRNFYELNTMGRDCPLFQFIYYLETGKDNFGLSDEEYNDEMNILDALVEEKFGCSILEKVNDFVSEEL